MQSYMHETSIFTSFVKCKAAFQSLSSINKSIIDDFQMSMHMSFCLGTKCILYQHDPIQAVRGEVKQITLNLYVK